MSFDASPVVQVRQVGKCFRLFRSSKDRVLNLLLAPFGRSYAAPFWALNDVSFEVSSGETLGLIGKNGSGKSTLLQIIVGTLQPTTGSVSTRGRITALLELGAGFNPEFTGRENVYLNGAILGFNRKEMDRMLPDILEFADIGEYIDQPVKHYSSGMYLRLAFSVAACVDPDILVVDEALAVGDAGFVIKCMKRISDLKKQGKTIILVTHDIQTVRSVCDRVIWLDAGRVRMAGKPLDVTSEYVQYLFRGDPEKEKQATDHTMLVTPEILQPATENEGVKRWGKGGLIIQKCWMGTADGWERSQYEYGDDLRIRVTVQALEDIPSSDVGVGMGFRNNKGLDVITSTTYDEGRRFDPIRKGQIIELTFAVKNILSPGAYALVLSVEDRSEAVPTYYDFIEDARIFNVVSRKPIYSLVLPHVEQTVSLNSNSNSERSIPHDVS